MNDALTLVHTPHEFRVRATLPLPQDDAWDRLTTVWLPAWLGIESLPLMVGGLLRPHAPDSADAAPVGRVLGSSLGHRMRVMVTSPVTGGPIVVQASVLADGPRTALEVDVQDVPSTEELERLRSIWGDRVSLVEREVSDEFRAYRRSA
ncbi:MAG: hypothetical protein Q4G21_03765 [Dermabacter sp.]|nr:hypothetical protein [Dermabacter sp.]